MTKTQIVDGLNHHTVGGRSDWTADPSGGVRPSSDELVYCTEYFALATTDAEQILDRLDPSVELVWSEDHFQAYKALQEYFKDNDYAY